MQKLLKKRTYPNQIRKLLTRTAKLFIIGAQHGDYENNTKEEQKPGNKNSRRAKKYVTTTRTLRRRYDPHSRRTIFAPSRPNKHSREQITEIDTELLQRANRLGAATSQLQTK